MRRQAERSAGVTLIEMVVVLSVVLILATIAISSFRSYDQRAQKLSSLSSLRNLAEAVRMYKTDYKGFPPCAGTCALDLMTYIGGYTNVTAQLTKFEDASDMGGGRGADLYIDGSVSPPRVYLRGLAKGMTTPGSTWGGGTGVYQMKYYLTDTPDTAPAGHDGTSPTCRYHDGSSLIHDWILCEDSL